MSRDPVRLALADDAPPLAAEALRLAREDGPGAARLQAIEAAVRTRIALPKGPSGEGGDSGGGDGGGSGAGDQGLRPGGSFLSPIAKAGAAAMAAGVTIVAVVLATRTPSPSSVVHEAPSAARATAARDFPPVPTNALSLEPPAFSVNDLPAAPDAAASSTKRREVFPSASAALDALDSAETERAEVALLDRAQASLSTRPADTLASCDEHARRYAGGALVQEREVLAIDALLRSSRREEATARADRFRKAFPRSGHLRRVDALLAR